MTDFEAGRKLDKYDKAVRQKFRNESRRRKNKLIRDIQTLSIKVRHLIKYLNI